MKTRNELIEKIKSLNNEAIKVETYTGFSYLHVDLYVENIPALWCAVACNEEIGNDQKLDLKISDINDIIFHYDDNAETILKRLIFICKECGISKIHGRIAVCMDFDKLKEFYNNLGFTIVHTPNDKSYDSAKINIDL